MHIIARPAIDAAMQKHTDAKAWLEEWWSRASKARWRNLAEVRVDYPPTDQVNCCLIFDVKGNKYRLICRRTYANEWTQGTLLVKHFLTHSEYDKNAWAKDCQ
jgi:mRNA interferase HigB